MTNIPETFSDVVFRWNGDLYQGGTFLQFPTGDPRNPVMFISTDHREVFLLAVNDIGVLNVTRLSPAALATWERDCQHAPTKKAIRRCRRLQTKSNPRP